MNRWTKYLSKSGTIRIVTIDAGIVVEEMAANHGLNGSLTLGLGEGALAGLLLAASHKSGERINLSIQGSGVWKRVVVDADPDGFVRAFIYSGESDHSSRGPWGNGIITVLQTQNNEGKQPYSGMVTLGTGFLDKDMSIYWNQSAQIPTTIVFSKNGKKALMAQAITGASPEDVEQILSCGPEFRKLVETDILKAGSEWQKIFPEHSFSIMEDTPIAFRCNCSQERVEQALLLTGQDDIRYLIANDEAFEMKCDFCSTVYKVNRERAEELMRTLTKKGN